MPPQVQEPPVISLVDSSDVGKDKVIVYMQRNIKEKQNQNTAEFVEMLCEKVQELTEVIMLKGKDKKNSVPLSEDSRIWCS